MPFPSARATRWPQKAQGVKLGGLHAKGIANRQDALERAEQLRPVFAELAGMSHRGIPQNSTHVASLHQQAVSGTPSR